MDKKTAAAQVNADYTQDQLQAQTDKALFDLGVISGLTYSKSKNTAEQLAAQHKLSIQQLDVNQKAIEVQLASPQTKIDQAKALLDLYQNQARHCRSRAGISGSLAPLATPLQVGQHVTAGTSVAEVIQLDKLKAALQIAETQARDIQIGQPASIDTHNGVIPGHVTRIDPSVVNGTRTVDVELDGPLPAGAVPQLSVDGTIDLERMTDVLYVGPSGAWKRKLDAEPVQDRSGRQRRNARACKSGPRFGQQHPGDRRIEGRRHRDSLGHVALGQRGPHQAGVAGMTSRERAQSNCTKEIERRGMEWHRTATD